MGVHLAATNYAVRVLTAEALEESEAVGLGPSVPPDINN